MTNLTIKEIESAIEQLSENDFKKLANWFEEFQSQNWDKQIEEDLQNGRLKDLIEQAESDYAMGKAQEL